MVFYGRDILGWPYVCTARRLSRNADPRVARAFFFLFFVEIKFFGFFEIGITWVRRRYVPRNCFVKQDANPKLIQACYGVGSPVVCCGGPAVSSFFGTLYCVELGQAMSQRYQDLAYRGSISGHLAHVGTTDRPPGAVGPLYGPGLPRSDSPVKPWPRIVCPE